MPVQVDHGGRAVRISNHRRARLRAVSAALAAALAIGACSGAAPSAPPSRAPAATPAPTLDPHLAEPASVDVVFSKLSAAGLRIVGNNADRGSEPVARINATYAGWPLILSQYSSAAAARKATGLAGMAAVPSATPVASPASPKPTKPTKSPKPTKAPKPNPSPKPTPSPKPGPDQAPFTFEGMNIVVEFGPYLVRADEPAPDQRFVDAAAALAHALDELLGPLVVRAVVPIALTP
ncbi:MAG TPA: hypothetical protein VFI28_09865 [Candidatus Limnocylindrales bacterium]|nr:hypothetical protein [Candidatus Limnocylindrales bacterium]